MGKVEESEKEFFRRVRLREYKEKEFIDKIAKAVKKELEENYEKI